ncbi:hypothetical protein ACF08M_17240 [Streptomyces sp. NPDC015032]|uniref:hypothetical protein n=1 Tax=Streptomyces sp. NPDC015032 TaxID=3364937 RepID=UPI0036FD9E0D
MSRRDHGNENSRENGRDHGNETGREHESRIDRTGNGIVNDGPERDGPEREGPGNDGPEREGSGNDGSGNGGSERVAQVNAAADPGADLDADSDAGGGADLDEVALRRMLHGAVQHIEPGDGTLDLLQRAVPARRARRRQAVVGMAAAALLIGTAVPAFVHVANSDGANAANPAIAGHGEQAQGGNGTENGSAADGKSDGGSTGGQADGGPSPSTSTSSPSDSRGQGTDGGLAGGVLDPSASAAAAMPDCDPGQLSVASAETGAAGADGTVYGTFRIANVSGTGCSVSSGGSVGFQAMGAADPSRITVVQHTAGDAAAGLPDPSQEQGTVRLKPSMAYEVKFAWVPKDTCPASGGSPSPTPTDGAGGATSAGPGAGTPDGVTDTSPQLGSEDGGGTLDGSVAVTHTPEPGAPVAEAKITNACAGTIYRTGVLAPAT